MITRMLLSFDGGDKYYKQNKLWVTSIIKWFISDMYTWLFSNPVTWYADWSKCFSPIKRTTWALLLSLKQQHETSSPNSSRPFWHGLLRRRQRDWPSCSTLLGMGLCVYGLGSFFPRSLLLYSRWENWMPCRMAIWIVWRSYVCLPRAYGWIL